MVESSASYGKDGLDGDMLDERTNSTRRLRETYSGTHELEVIHRLRDRVGRSLVVRASLLGRR